MDDLSGLVWSTKRESARKAQPYGVPSPAFPALRPTPPTSGRSSPLPKPSSNPPSKTQTPANDSFSNLVSFGSASANRTLSLQEQQKRLLEQKAQQQAVKQKQLGSHYSGGDEQFWSILGSGRSTPSALVSPSVVPGTQFANYTAGSNRNGLIDGGISQPNMEEEDDILAAFKADAPVDSSSHFPKPFEHSLASGSIRSEPRSTGPMLDDSAKASNSHDLFASDDDDPFGLAPLPKERSRKPQESIPQNDTPVDDEDVLGLLGKPISELPRPQKIEDSVPVLSQEEPIHPQDHVMAELMEMGFPAERAREALESTESGTDVQQAVGWLLNKAHSESRQRAEPRRSSNDGPRQSRDPKVDRKSGSRPNVKQCEGSEIAWSNDRRPERSKQQRSQASTKQLENGSAQVASEFGTTFLKTAGSLWKTSTKKVQQAVQEFNSDSDSSQPKWMREPETSRSGQGLDLNNANKASARSHPRGSTNEELESVTDEAMMLESDQARPPPRKPPRRQEPTLDSSADNSRDHSPAMPSRLRPEIPAQPAFLRQQQAKAQSRSDSKAALSRQAIEDQASQAYVSSARRRKPACKPPISVSEPDLLEGVSRSGPTSASPPATTQPFQFGRPPQSPKPVVLRPVAPSRKNPHVSLNSLKASHADREVGDDRFKRGDYSAAHQSYTSSLKHLPVNHPITIILHTNRALTALKIGEPKTAISDTETAISIIGLSRGEAETIDLSNGEPPKPMRDYIGKALMRRAEALEQMEKWKEAAIGWKEAVEGGHGGATSIQGRLRCEKSAAPQQQKRAKPSSGKKSIAARPTRLAVSEPNGTVNRSTSTAAVNKLRAANAAADRADDEKFALADTVDAKLVAWKGGKADNLRALLASLDTVLRPEAGWKKIGMAELVLPGKVKVQYMKGIAKVHPDKVCQLGYLNSKRWSWKGILDQGLD